MVVVSGNIGSAPLIGSKVIRDGASDGSVWREKGPRIRHTPESDQSCVRSSDTSYARVRPVLRPVRGGPDARWSKKAPLLTSGP